MTASHKQAALMGMPVYPLYAITASYRTPSGRCSSATFYLRRETAAERSMFAKIETCANPRRRVARGVDGITLTEVRITNRKENQ